MKNYVFDGEEDSSSEEKLEEDETSDEDGFDEGYNDEKKTTECPECGSAVPEGKGVTREINGEEMTFCSNECANEFEESLTE